MLVTSIIIICIILIILAVIFTVWLIRKHRFRPGTNQLEKQAELNADLKDAGFAYEMNGDYFYSLMNCWQRDVGYCRLYDEAAPLFNMIMDCEPVTFAYGGKRWLIELWKGQYGITTGGEIGVYNTERGDIEDDRFTGTFYESIEDDERLGLSFVLKKNGKVILRRKDVHWWLTGFKLGEFSEPNALTMDAAITFPDRQMRDAFTDGLIRIGYSRHEFSVRMKTVSIHYTKPHSPQTESRNKVKAAIVQKTNHSNCYLYETATGEYSHTLDKLEFLKAMVPELYTLFMESLYAKGIYEAFGWIKEWLEGKHPNPGPKPPHPPCAPCPPKPPCDPCPPKHSCGPCHPCDPCPPRRGCIDSRCRSANSRDEFEESRSCCGREEQ